MRRFLWVGLMLTIISAVALAQTPAQTPPQTPPAPAARPAAATQTTPANPGTKIAVVNFEQAILESDAGKAATAQYNKDIEPEKAKFEKVAKEVDDLQKKLQDAKTEAERGPIRNELESKTREAQFVQETAQRKSDELKQKLLSPIAILANKVIDRYAQANNLAIVFDPTTQDSNIVFANKASDITSEVIRGMNEEFAKDPKLAAPAASAPAAPAKPVN
jgi:Skp family chaperone for outer membrane proteins